MYFEHIIHTNQIKLTNTMKFAKLFAAAMCFAAVLTACQEPEAPVTPNKGMEIAVSAQMYNFTKATDSAFEDGDQIGLHVVTNNAYINNAKYTYAGGSLTSEVVNYWHDDESVEADVLAYYPYNVNATYKAEGYTFTVEADQAAEGGYAASDLLVAATKSYPTKETVALPFRHALSKVVINIESELDEAIQSVMFADVYGSAVIDLKEGSAAVNGQKGTIKAAKVAGKESYTLIVVPQSAATPRILVAVEGDKQYTFNISAATDFEAGKVATANITLTKELIGTEFSAEITDWVGDSELQFNPSEENTPTEPEDPELPEEPFLAEKSVWALYGAWEDNTWTDMFFYTTPVEGIVVAEGVVFSNDAQNFLVRKPSTLWADKYGAGSVNFLQTNKYVALAKDGGDIRIERAGTYDIYFNVNTHTIYIMAADADYTTATQQTANGTAPDASTMSWGLVGEFNGWSTPDVKLEWDGVIGLYVAKNVALSGEFKVRADELWSDSFGSGSTVTVGAVTTVYYNGGNCSVAAGTYDVYFWYDTAITLKEGVIGKLWVNTAGAAAPSL